MSSCFTTLSQSIVSPSIKSIKVLAIDTSTSHLLPLVKFLETQGYQLQVQLSSKRDVASIQTAQPDLIVINLRVMGSEGYQLCRCIREHAASQDIPVVLLGDGVSKVQSIMALRSGAHEYLMLPLRVEESALRLEKHLQQSSLIRRLKADNLGLSYQLQENERILREQESQHLNLAQQNQELKKLAFIDGLTQVANRRGFNQHFHELWSLLGRSQQPLAMILGDVDHFKAYNDTYGHPAGDSCLKMIAEVIAQVARRTSDFVARYGGEEFAILLPATDSAGAVCVAKDIGAALALKRWPHKASPTYPFVSMSLGVASLVPRPFIAGDRLIQLADEALYQAKLNGRNQFVVSHSSYLPVEKAAIDYSVNRVFVESNCG